MVLHSLVPPGGLFSYCQVDWFGIKQDKGLIQVLGRGELLWWLSETGEGGAEKGFVRPWEVVRGRDVASPQL